jgi:peptidoglycan/xylan/chitin deacetylase (PgdA/CDA1 family)
MKIYNLLLCFIFSMFLMGLNRHCKMPGVIALTFDDGLTRKSVRILDVLEQKNVKATFFVVGETLLNQNNFLTLKRISGSGHVIGNHSWTHPFLTRITESQFKLEILNTQNGINLVTNKHYYCRPPFGAINHHIQDELNKLGFTIVFWNLDLRDWEPKSKDKEWRSYEKIIRRANPLKDNFIFIMHEKENTINLLPRFIDFAIENKFRFVTIDECLKAE